MSAGISVRLLSTSSVAFLYSWASTQRVSGIAATRMFAALDVITGDNHLKRTSNSGPLKKWSCGGARRTRRQCETQLHLPQFFQSCFRGRKQAYPICEKFGRDLAAAPHQFLNRRGEMKS